MQNQMKMMSRMKKSLQCSNALCSTGTAPAELSLGHFPRQKLHTFNNWPGWPARERKQADQFCKLGVCGEPCKLPPMECFCVHIGNTKCVTMATVDQETVVVDQNVSSHQCMQLSKHASIVLSNPFNNCATFEGHAVLMLQQVDDFTISCELESIARHIHDWVGKKIVVHKATVLPFKHVCPSKICDSVDLNQTKQCIKISRPG